MILYSFFLEVYLNTAGSPHEVGTENLFKNPLLWKAIKMLVLDEISQYHTQQYPVMTEEQEEFAYEGLLQIIKIVIQDHYNKDLYPESTRVLNEIAGPLCAFAERVLSDISNTSHIKVLCSLMLQLKKATTIAGDVIVHLSNKLQLNEAGISESTTIITFVMLK